MVEKKNKSASPTHSKEKVRIQRGKSKGKTQEVKRSRARLKACDPFSGRHYKTVDADDVNLEPDNSEMEDYVDTEKDDTTKYTSYKQKPKYRRNIVFAEELEDMKQHKKEKKQVIPSEAVSLLKHGEE
ncbi:hypothetical protein WA588_001475 [Blastocystis sp. NMH]